MRTAIVLIAIVAAAVFLAACGNDEPSEAPPTGIEGQVLVGPQCPVEIEGTPCPDAPYAATVEVWNVDRTERITTFETGKEDGAFRVPLPPGDYYLDPQPPKSGGPPTGEGQEVTVPAEGFLEVTVHYDSGIR